MKKMVYLYICTYAAVHPELSLLAINTLQKDCRDEDPMTRGLALRSFTSLRLPNITEYLPQVINSGLQDQSPYVRKTAVIGVIKLAMVAPECAAELVDTLYKMIRDRDPQVVAHSNPNPNPNTNPDPNPNPNPHPNPNAGGGELDLCVG